MHRHIAHLVAVSASLPLGVIAQERDPESVVRERGIPRMQHRVTKCSITENEQSLGGPMKVRFATDEWGNPDKVEVLSKSHRGTDVGKCVLSGAQTIGGGKTPVVSFTHEFEFHPWAERSRRKWSDVKKVVEGAGLLPALQSCTDRFDEEQSSAKTRLHFTIRPDGSLRQALKTTNPKKRECLKEVLNKLPSFPPAGNTFYVGFVLDKGRDKPIEFEGRTVEPLSCELAGRPCSMAEADRKMTKWSFELMDRAMKEKKMSCQNIDEVAKWLKTQKHVEGVSVSGCTLMLQVKDAMPTSFHSH